MSIYDFDTEKFIEDFVPPDKRLPKIFAHSKATASGIQFNIDEFQVYRKGVTYNPWSSLTTYVIGDLVVYEGSQFKSTTNSNLNNIPYNTSFWVLTQKQAIGSDERIKYNAKRLIFEYALNRYFGGTFRQPPNTSDIFIKDLAFFNNSFLVGGIENNSSNVYLSNSSGLVVNDYLVQPPTSFSINVPTIIYNEHGGTDIPFLNFANTITIAGKTPSILVY